MVNLWRNCRVASRAEWTYVSAWARLPENGMPAIVNTATLPRPLLLIALVVALLLAVTFGLWGYYGTAVFFEMVRTGWAACF